TNSPAPTVRSTPLHSTAPPTRTAAPRSSSTAPPGGAGSSPPTGAAAGSVRVTGFNAIPLLLAGRLVQRRRQLLQLADLPLLERGARRDERLGHRRHRDARG